MSGSVRKSIDIDKKDLILLSRIAISDNVSLKKTIEAVISKFCSLPKEQIENLLNKEA